MGDHWDYDVEEVATKAGNLARKLAETDVLTDPEADAYALRGVYNVSRSDAAEILDKSPNTIDNQLASAEKKVVNSAEIWDVLDEADAGVDSMKRAMDEATIEPPNDDQFFEGDEVAVGVDDTEVGREVSIYDQTSQGWNRRYTVMGGNARELHDLLGELFPDK